MKRLRTVQPVRIMEGRNRSDQLYLIGACSKRYAN